MNSQSVLKGLGLVLLIAGLGIAGSILPLRSWLQQASGFAADLGAYGVLLVSLTYIVATLLLVPGILITLAVTAVYGWWAIAICIVNGLVSSMIAFLLGRFVIRDAVKALMKRYRTVAALDAIAKEQTFRVVFLTRLTPFAPFALENYCFGATSARIAPYILATLTGIVPGTLLNVYIGIVGRSAAEGQISSIEWAVLGLGLIAAASLLIFITKEMRRRLSQIDGKSVDSD